MKTILAELLKRAFTNDGGSLVRIREEDGSISWKTVWALILRVGLILLAGLGAYHLGLI